MNDRNLFVFSLAFIVWAGLLIVVPYVRRRRDLLSAHNFFMLGSIIFVGLSGLNASYGPHYKDNYSSKTYFYYYLGILVFFSVFRLAYNHLKWPNKLALNHFKTWPRQEGMGLWAPLILAMIASAGQVALLQVPGLRALVLVTGLMAPVFAMTFALAIWRQAKMNPIAITAVIAVFAMGAILAIGGGGGRRPLYGLVVAIPCCFYWWHLRYKKPTFVLGLFAVGMLFVPLADAAYRAARWKGVIGVKRVEREEGVTLRWSIFKDSLMSGENSLLKSTVAIGQNAVECSLLTTHIFKSDLGSYAAFQVKPFHSLYVIATLPIPRALWEDKPRHLGLTLPFDSKVLPKTTKTNWGPGIVGHGYHDGGLLVLVIYALLAGGTLKFIDNLLVLHPGNPYLLGFLGGASVQIAGWIRGDISSMTSHAMLCFVVMLVLASIAKFMAGVERTWQAAPAGAPQLQPT